MNAVVQRTVLCYYYSSLTLMLSLIKLTSKTGRMFTLSSARLSSQSRYSTSILYIWYIKIY